MKKVLVFGGIGFLGSYLVEELKKRSYKITVADILENHHVSVDFIPCDISNREEVNQIFKTNTYDIVYNLAGFANLDNAVGSPIKTIELNVVSNMYILEACVKYNIEKFVYASSAYAMSNKGSYYGISKLASEKIIEEYNKIHDLQFVILRYGSVYSERKHLNNYIYNLVENAVLEGEINHAGDGEEVREYIHAADAARLSVDVIESNEYNNIHVILTGTERIRRVELFQMIKEILNDKVQINLKGEHQVNHYKYTPYSFSPSVSKRLTANPHIDMGQGLLECIRFVNNNE